MQRGDEVSWGLVALLFVREAIGGAAFGFVLGYAAYLVIRTVDDYQVEILITLALAAGGYALAGALHLSGPIAMAAAGLVVGSRGWRVGMSEETRGHLGTFWSVVDDILHVVLFLLMGLEVLMLNAPAGYLLAGLLAIPITLLARFVSVAVPTATLRIFYEPRSGTIPILTWGGLRDGVSVALALSLPPTPDREMLLACTFAVVVFSILIQGPTLKPLVRHFVESDRQQPAPD